MKVDIYQQVTDRVIQAIESGNVSPWVKPWANGKPQGGDFNTASGKAYRGINRLLLGLSGYSGNEWGSYKQWSEKGGQVRKGEKGTNIVFFSPIEKINKETGEKESFLMARGYSVFNRDQVDNLKTDTTNNPELPALPENESTMLAKELAMTNGVQVANGGNRAFYRLDTDTVYMPEETQFNDVGGYAATLLHEIIHWTGHPDREAREFGKRFGSDAYAFEELVAEMGAAFLCAQLGVQGEQRHEGYIDSWLRVMRGDKRAIFTAASKAESACKRLLVTNQVIEEEVI